MIRRIELAGSLDSPFRARAWARSMLEGRARPAVVDDAVLLISELVTNAVVHARTSVELVLDVTAEVIRAEVTDHGHGSVPAAMQAEVLDEGGRGLAIVETVARRWGWRPGPDATCVWFEVVPS